MTCASSRAQRLVRGIVALIMVAYAVSALPTEPVLGIAAGVIALGMAVSAITGVCPLGRVPSGRRPETASLGYDDGRAFVDLSNSRTSDKWTVRSVSGDRPRTLR